MMTTTLSPDMDSARDLSTEVVLFDLDAVRMWQNARQEFSQAGLRELADSLLDSGGALQCPVGYRVDEPPHEVELFLGERRWRAYRMLRDEGHAAFAKLPVRLVRKPADRELYKWHLAENLQREDLRPSDTGEWLCRMMGLADEYSGNPLWTTKSLAEEIGKPVSWVSLAMLLVRAPESVRKAVDAGECPLETGALIGGLPPGLREGAAMEMVHGPMGAMTRDQARAHVADQYRRDLRTAAFDAEESGLGSAPACVRCEWWGGNRTDVGGKAAAYTCLNPGCFLEKQRVAVVRRAEEAGAQMTIWAETSEGSIWEAHSGKLAPDSGYVELSERPSPQLLDSEIGDGLVMPSWREILRDTGVVPMVAFDGMGQAREIVGTGEALRGAASSRWGSLFKDGALAAYLSPEERAAERAVRAAGDREWQEGIVEGLHELRVGLAEVPGYPMLIELLRHVLGSTLKSEDLAVLASVLGADGKSVDEVLAAVVGHEMNGEDALALALLVRRVRYEGFAVMCEDEAAPLDRLAKLAKFNAGDWHKRLKRRREAAERQAREEEERKAQARARKQIAEAARGRE